MGICCPDELEKTAKIIEEPNVGEENDLESTENENYLRSSQFQGKNL